MATATALGSPTTSPPANRPDLVSVGTIIWLSSELMFFAALFAVYFTLRSVQGPDVWQGEFGNSMLNVRFSTLNTLVLVASSVTCQMGVFAAERFDVKRLRLWFCLTFLMGAFFIGGQVYEYASLDSEGLGLSRNAFSSIFYLSTGFHGLHVTGGLLAFLLVLGRTFLTKRFGHREQVSAIVVSYYWHFVDVVWIGLFFTIYVIK